MLDRSRRGRHRQEWRVLARTTLRRDGYSRRSRKNRPPRSPDAEPDFAGTRAPWSPPRWRWRNCLQAFRDGCVRTRAQAAASSLQARAKCSTAYWYEPDASGEPSSTNAVIVYYRADPRNAVDTKPSWLGTMKPELWRACNRPIFPILTDASRMFSDQTTVFVSTFRLHCNVITLHFKPPREIVAERGEEAPWRSVTST